MNTSPVSIVIRAFLQWWWLIVVSAAVGIGVGYFVRADQPDIYLAKATVLVGQDPRYNSSTSFGNGGNTLLEAYSVFATRPNVLQPVINELSLNTTPDNMAKSMELNSNRDASLLEIYYYDTDPERAALIANRIALELVNQSLRSNTTQNIDFIRGQLTDLENQIGALQANLNTLAAEANNITSAMAFNQNRTERSQIEDLLNDLRDQYSRLNSGLTNLQGQVTLFEEALPNYWPAASNSILDLVLAGAAGVALAVLTIILITFFDDRLQWQETNFETVEDLRVLGPLGIIPQAKLPLYSQTMLGSIEVEALRQIRDKIFLAGDNRPQVLSFVSYDSGDGKTVTTANMAATFANSGLRTIVIDLDMRKGDLHEVFRLPNIIGISDVLAAGDPLEDIMHEAILDSGVEGLSLMTAGRSTTDPSALLGRSRFPQLIYLLRQEYDAIIMDSVPTIAGTDSVFLAEVSDGVVIVVKTRHTSLSGLRRTIANLKEAQDVHILGVVFNRVRLQITSKYSSPYYHPSTTLRKAQQLNQEFLQPANSSSPMSFRARVLVDRNGERLYSFSAAATRLGVRERTVKQWVATGYINARRHYLRHYITESEIQSLLKRLPTHETPMPHSVSAPIPYEQAVPQSAVPIMPGVDLSNLPDQLREQRAALLNYVNQPAATEHNNNQNSHE